MTDVTDEMVETAWAAIVGSDIAKTCFNASIIRADLKAGITAALAANNQEAWVAALLNSPNPEQALAATPAVATSASPCLNCCCPSDELFCGMCREMGCSIPSATPAVDGEPVAYRWKYEDEKSWTFAKKRPDHLYYGKDVICEPLYLAAQPAPQPAVGGEALPTYGSLPWDQLGLDVNEAMTGERFAFQHSGYPGHSLCPINFNSLARIVDKYRLAAQPASPLRGSQDVPYPVYKAVERILDENSAWIARPSDEVTKRIALAATVAAHSIIAASPPEQPAAPLPGQIEHTDGSGPVLIQPAADPVTGRETIREIVHANAKTTLIGFNEISDQNAEFICDQISRKVELALLSTAPDKQPLRYGEPVWPGNENDDLDKGSDA